MDLASRVAELLWIGSLAAVPLALIVAAACRWPGCRPATRHAMWAAVLVSFVAPALASLIWRPDWFQSQRVLAAAQPLLQPASSPIGEPAPAITLLPPRPAERSAATPIRSVTSEPTDSNKAPKSSLDSKGPQRPGVIDLPTPARRDPAQPVLTGSHERAKQGTAPALPQARSTVVVELPTRRDTSVPPSTAQPARSAALRAAPASAGWRREMGAWLEHLLLVRDEIARIPPLPVALWFGGAVIIVVCWALRAALVCRVLLRAQPATASTLRLVAASAQRMGLRRVPQTVIVDDRVSPMILCGPRPRLVLPSQLWHALDDASRFAVVTHELAHLRRRDHHLSWLVALVGIVYWWHPVAWWVRWRLRDEADACCDAWVTSLLPTSRRAYAEALVVTKSFLSLPGRCAPLGLGVMSGRARCLARRIKMVMTQRVAPRASPMGAIAALSIAVAGMLVMPALACPPESQSKESKSASVRKHEMEMQKHKEQRAKESKKAPKAESPKVEFFGEAPALEAMRGATSEAGNASDQPNLSDREIQRLEERLLRLERRIMEYQSRQRGPRSMGSTPAAPAPFAVQPSPAPSPAPAGHPSPRAQPSPSTAPAPAPQPPGTPAPSGPTPTASTAPSTEPPPGALLPGLAFTTAPLMTINVVERAQDIERAYFLPPEKLRALTALMARDDVPVLIQAFDDHIVVRAPEPIQRVFADFVLLINPEGFDASAAASLAPNENTDQAVRSLRDRLKELERARGEVEREAERLRNRLASAQEKSQSFREKAELLREQADEAEKDSQRVRLRADSERYSARAESVEAESHDLEAKVAEAESLSEVLGAEIESLEVEIESLVEAMETASNQDDESDDDGSER